MNWSVSVWYNSTMGSFFSSLKTERTAQKSYRTHNTARRDVFDFIECLYNPMRRRSTLGHVNSITYAQQA